MAPTGKKSPLKSKNRAKMRVKAVFQARKRSESLSSRNYLHMERRPSLPLDTEICSEMSRFFVLSIVLTIILVHYPFIFTIIFDEPFFILHRGFDRCGHHRTRDPNTNRIFSIFPEWLFNGYITVFRRSVNFFPHAWHLKSRMASCLPCVPHPTNAWMFAAVTS